MNQDSFKQLFPSHQDFIHDIAYDWYGQKLATCSNDRTVKIWQKSSSGKWELINTITEQDGPIQKVVWAHPEFGNILAACSMERFVNIYEENKDFRTLPKEIGEQSYSNQWKMTKIYDEKEAIVDMKFGPKHLGLVLAVARADGTIRIFQFSDLLNLSIRQRSFDIFVSHLGINCISWNKNRFEQAMIAVGCKDQETRIDKGMMMTMMATTMMNGGKQSIVGSKGALDDDHAQAQQSFQIFNLQHDQLALSNPVRVELQSKDHSLMHLQAVNDVSWSLMNGRSFHLIATGGREGARIWYLKYQNNNNTMQVQRVINLFSSESSNPPEIWKISWNMMASLIATSDYTEGIKIFKNRGIDKWEPVKTIKDNNEKDAAANAQM